MGLFVFTHEPLHDGPLQRQQRPSQARKHTTTRDVTPDAATYIRNSESFSSLGRLLEAEAFGRNYWVAGYSGFIHLFASLGEFSLVGVRMAQVTMALSMAFMAYQLTKHLSDRTAMFTFLAVALSPTLLRFSLVIGYEVFLGWLVTLSLTLVWQSRSSARPVLLIAFGGLAYSVALVVQFKIVILLPVLLYLVAMSSRRFIPAYLTAAVVPLLVWMGRNFVALGNIQPWSNNGPVNVWIGNNPYATGGFIATPPIPSGWPTSFVSAAMQFATTQPRDFMELQARKALRFFYPNVPLDFHVPLPTVVDAFLVLAFWLWAVVVAGLFVLYVAGSAWRVAQPIRSLDPIALMVVLFFLSNLPFIMEPRFRVTVDALMLVVAVPTLLALTKRWRTKGINSAASS